MKTLHIIPNLRKGGAERLVSDIVRELAKRDGIEVRLVIFQNEIAYDIEDILPLVHIIPSSLQLSLCRKNKYNITDLQLFIENFQPDIIHSHLFEAEVVSRSCNYPSAKWFSHVHDNMVQLKNWSWSSISKTNSTNWYEKQILFRQYKKNGGTQFIAISKHSESYIKSVQSNCPVTLLHNAIDVKRFQKPNPSQTPLTTYDSPLTINDSPLTINLINIGSFVPKKNQTFLLDILLEIKERGVQANCLFLGEGPLKTEVQNRAIELGISNQCQFVGNNENVEEYLWISDVYVHTANYEPLGLVLLEAMSAGLPVVTLDGGGNRDLMINGKNGFLIENQNPEEFADRIIEVYQNEEKSDFNAEFAKQFDITEYCDNLLKIYTTICDQNK